MYIYVHNEHSPLMITPVDPSASDQLSGAGQRTSRQVNFELLIPRSHSVLLRHRRTCEIFMLPGKGVRFDLSMVRQTHSVAGRRDFEWVTSFLPQSLIY